MSTLTVKAIEKKTGTNTRGSYTNWIVTFTTGSKASTFDPEIGTPLDAGQTRDFNIELKGQYKTIIDYGPILEGTPAQGKEADVPKEVWDAKDREKAMSYAFQSSCTFYQGRDVDIKLVDKLAQAIYKRVQEAKEGNPYSE